VVRSDGFQKHCNPLVLITSESSGKAGTIPISSKSATGCLPVVWKSEGADDDSVGGQVAILTGRGACKNCRLATRFNVQHKATESRSIVKFIVEP